MKNIPLFVSADWLHERLDDHNLRIIDATSFLGPPLHEAYIDVSTGQESYEKQHIKGAVFADLFKDFSETGSGLSYTIPSREKFTEEMSKLGVGEGTYVVIYDQGVTDDNNVAVSYWATRLAWQLRYEGFAAVAVLDGGLVKWMEEERPTASGIESYPQGNFVGERNPQLFVGKDEVLAAIDDENVLIVDALPPDSFKGDPSSERSGHIPGSVNLFFGFLTDFETKEIFPDETLQDMFEKLGLLDPSKKVIVYCGFGVAGTWIALLLNKLGQNRVAVYDGSLEEWASNQSLPLEVSEN